MPTGWRRSRARRRACRADGRGVRPRNGVNVDMTRIGRFFVNPKYAIARPSRRTSPSRRSPSGSMCSGARPGRLPWSRLARPCGGAVQCETARRSRRRVTRAQPGGEIIAIDERAELGSQSSGPSRMAPHGRRHEDDAEDHSARRDQHERRAKLPMTQLSALPMTLPRLWGEQPQPTKAATTTAEPQKTAGSTSLKSASSAPFPRQSRGLPTHHRGPDVRVSMTRDCLRRRW